MEVKETRQKSPEKIKNRLSEKMRGPFNVKNMGEEITDCIILLMDLTDELNLDIEKGMMKKYKR